MNFIHIDVDNLWIYESELSVSSAKPSEYHYDAIYDNAAENFLNLLDAYQLKATFFVVGCEVKRSSCRRFLVEAVNRGHRIANHTFSHRPDFGFLSREKKRDEVLRGADAIEDVINVKLTGFRSPGYYLDDDIIDVLVEQNYVYDSSVLPSPLTTFMGTYIKWKGGGGLKKQFGRRRYMFAPRKPFLVNSKKSEKAILELPLLTSPLFALPVHSTFLHMYGPSFYFFILSASVRKQSVQTFLFHIIDFLRFPLPSLEKRVPTLKMDDGMRLRKMEAILEYFKSGNMLAEEVASDLLPDAQPSFLFRNGISAI